MKIIKFKEMCIQRVFNFSNYYIFDLFVQKSRKVQKFQLNA